MQEEAEREVLAMAIDGGEISAEVLCRAMGKVLEEIDRRGTAEVRGKQSLKDLSRSGAVLKNIEITRGNIYSFERTARKYHIDYALKKDTQTEPGRYIVFFKAKDNDTLMRAFKDYREYFFAEEKKTSIDDCLDDEQSARAGMSGQKERVKNKYRGRNLTR